MKRQSRFFRYITIALLIVLVPVFAFGTAVAVTGTVTVSVEERDGVKLYIPVPALLFDAALLVAPMVLPDDALADARREIAPFRQGLKALAEEIADCPPGTLVDVRSGDEHIQVSKGWRSFHIEVDSPDADVRVAVPARLASRALGLLD